MTGEDGHTSPSDFRCMNQVATNLWSSFHHCSHGNTCLEQLIADYDTYITGTHHQHSLPRKNTVLVHQSLNSTGSVYPRQVVAGKGEKLLRGPGGKNNALGLDFKIFFLPSEGCDHSILITTQDGGIGHNCDILLVPTTKLLGNIYAPGAGVMLTGPEEFVGLFYQLPTGIEPFIHQ